MTDSLEDWREELEKIEENNWNARRAADKMAIFRVIYTDWSKGTEDRWLVSKYVNRNTGVGLSGREEIIAARNEMNDVLGGYDTKKKAVDTAKKLAKYYAKSHKAGYVLVETQDGNFSKYMRYD